MGLLLSMPSVFKSVNITPFAEAITKLSLTQKKYKGKIIIILSTVIEITLNSFHIYIHICLITGCGGRGDVGGRWFLQLLKSVKLSKQQILFNASVAKI